MPRKKNPRRELLENARRLKENARRLIGQWNVTRSVYLEPHEREQPSQWFRPRREDEYPENDAEQLVMAMRFAQAIIADAQAIHDVSLKRLTELKRQEAEHVAR